MIMPSSVVDVLPNTIGTAGAISALHSQSNQQPIDFPFEWYVLTTPDPTTAITRLVSLVDAEIFEISQRLSHHYEPCEEEADSPEFYFFDEEPIVYFPPTRVGTFTMEVTSKRQGRVEAIFPPDDIEYLIDDSDV